ncbi:MAG: hypothetical protein KJ064_02000 [Anaerolineae bacterium]|nr:hypothetical protein [Anaerolineae bacterium]
MPGPSLVFGFMLATFYGSTFHFILGGDARRLALFLLAGWLGFALGQIVGEILQINAINIGPLHFFTATIGALIGLFTVTVLTNRTNEEL